MIYFVNLFGLNALFKVLWILCLYICCRQAEKKEMITKAIDIISKSDDNKGKVALNLIKYLLTMVFSGIIYTWIFGKFELIPINDIDKILTFFLSGNFLKPLIVFILVWHLFYTILDWFVSRYTISTANLFAQFPKYMKTKEGQNPPQMLKGIYRMLFKILIQISFFRYEGKELITGHSFHKFQKLIEDVKEGEDDIDIDFLIQCFVVTLQLMILLWGIDFINKTTSIGFNLSVTIFGILALIILWNLISLALAIRMYANPIHEKMIEMQEASEKFLEELKNKKLEEPQNQVVEKKDLKFEEKVNIEEKK